MNDTVPRPPTGVGRTRVQEVAALAAASFPGGVNSPVRAFRAVGRDPVVLVRGEGAYVHDADGTRYLDYIGGWGPAILGHAHPAVVEAVRDAASRGFALGATHPSEVELASRVRAAMPSMELLRFTSSGTEAAMSALRLARAATGRDVVVKFAGAYHGHADAFLVEAGSGIATQGIPGSAGVTEAVARDTIVVPFNDREAVSLAFDRDPGRIAAVIVEPVAANIGVVPPVPGFLEHLRQVTLAHDALLIFDEVITGFRVGPRGAQGLYGITPDLTVLGKIVGGGMAIGAYGGRRDIMSLVAPVGPVYQAGTLSGHPLAMAAGIATLEQLPPERYALLEAVSAELERCLIAAARDAQRDVSVIRVGSLLTVWFGRVAPVDAAAALASDRAAFARFFGGMLDRRILLPPSQFEAWFVSLAHGGRELEATIDAASEAFRA